jgi:hypothetical protein
MSRSSNVRLMETCHTRSPDFRLPVYRYSAQKSGPFIYQHKRSEFS